MASIYISRLPTSFLGTLILPPPPRSPQGGGKMRDPGNEVASLLVFRSRFPLHVTVMTSTSQFVRYKLRSADCNFSMSSS